MTEKEKNPVTDDNLAPFYQPFQDAYEAYVKAVYDAWNQMQQQCQNNQLEMQQRLIKLSQAATPDELKAAQESLQQMASPTLDLSCLNDAYMQYKNAIQLAFANANMDDLDPASLWMIGQSFCMAAQFVR